ncbi:MAG: extracellular solute-binding protein [Patescibacteria group bacterium]
MTKGLFKKSLTGLILVSIISTFVLTGCRTKTPAEKKQSYSGIELTYYKVFDDSDVLDSMIEEYEGSHPGLVINYRQFSDFEEYQKVILNEMAEGEGPDIFSMPNTWFQSNSRKITPMPEVKGRPEDFNSTFVDVAYKDLVNVDQNGKERIFALPLTVDTLALYYNKAHFEDRIPERGRPSETWEGIKEDVAQLIKEDSSLGRFEVAGIALGRADNIDRAVDILYLLFLQYGVNFYNDDMSKAIFAGQQGNVTAYPGLESMEFFTSFADESQKHYTWNEFMANEVGKETESFAKGQVSMIVGYSYTYADIVNQMNLWDQKGIDVIDESDIGIAAIPQIYDPDISKDKRVTYASYFAETVSRNTKNPEIAWDFLIELSKKENLEDYFEKTNKPTSRRDMIEDQKKDPIYGVFASQVGYAESFPILDYYYYRELFADAIAKLNNSEDGENSLLDVQNKITELLPAEGLLVEEKVQDESEADVEE